MEKLTLSLQSAENALATLDEALGLPFTVIVRDASIQRFEYTFEATWKALKAFLQEQEGVVCASPKSCFRQALQSGLLALEEAEICLVMTDDRNLTSHTYIEAVAEAIYQKLPDYARVMRALLGNMQSCIAAQILDF